MDVDCNYQWSIQQKTAGSDCFFFFWIIFQQWKENLVSFQTKMNVQCYYWVEYAKKKIYMFDMPNESNSLKQNDVCMMMIDECLCVFVWVGGGCVCVRVRA